MVTVPGTGRTAGNGLADAASSADAKLTAGEQQKKQQMRHNQKTLFMKTPCTFLCTMRALLFTTTRPIFFEGFLQLTSPWERCFNSFAPGVFKIPQVLVNMLSSYLGQKAKFMLHKNALKKQGTKHG
jgi:hypothetical protein